MLLIFTLITSLCIHADSLKYDESVRYGWYCKRTKDHSQPPLPTEFSVINEYDGYYIGKDVNDKVVYLTFDAGYENGNVKKTLDILNKNNVSGAFFVLSNIINTSSELIKDMADSGHLVCNHTASHKDVSKISDFESFRQELCELESLYNAKTGRELSKYFRPPEGRFTEKTLQYAKEMGYKTVFWSFAYEDWDNNKQLSEESAKRKILDNIHNGAVILLHPTSDTNVKILDDIINELKGLGYRFGTLVELTEKN